MGIEQVGEVGEPSSMLSAWRHPQFRLVLASDFVSGAGDVLYWVALVVVLLDQPAGTALVSAAVVLRLVPRLLFGAFAGVIVDRFDCRRIMLFLDGARAVLMFAMAAAASGQSRPILMLVIVFVTCSISTPYRAAMSTAIPDLVGERALAGANSLDMTAGQIAAFCGPLVGAALLAFTEPSWSFVANGLTFLVSVALLWRASDLGADRERARTRRRISITAELSVGFRAVVGQVGVAVLVWISAAMMLLRGAELVLHVQVSTELLGLGPSGFGLMAGAMGAGSLLAAPLAGSVADAARPGRILLVSTLLASLTLGGLAVTVRPVAAMVVLVIAGGAAVMFEVVALTMLQRLCRSDVLGRVLGIQSTTNGGAKLAGSIAASWVTVAIGLRAALVIPSVIVIAATAMVAPKVLRLGSRSTNRRDEVKPYLDVLRRLGVFRGAPLIAVEGLARQLEIEQVGAGVAVVTQGDPADSFYVVADGEFSVRIDGDEVNRLGPHDWFGEIGLLHRRPRTASVVAATDATVWRMTGDAFVSAVTSSRDIPDSFADRMPTRVDLTDHFRDREPPSPAPR